MCTLHSTHSDDTFYTRVRRDSVPPLAHVPAGKGPSRLLLPVVTDGRRFSQPDEALLSGSWRQALLRSCPAQSSKDCSRVLCFEGSVLTSCDKLVKQIVGFSLQESEGFGDRLFLKQRMSLLSQMTSTPIDCLFKVRLWAQMCEERFIFLHLWGLFLHLWGLCRSHQGGLLGETLQSRSALGGWGEF